MASIQDIISQAVKTAAGNVEIPSNLKEKALSGLSESILGSLTQTAVKAGGIEQIKSLLTGKASAASSPVTALAGNLFKNSASKLGLGTAATSAISGLIPNIMSKLSGVLKDQDGDGDVDLQDILITLKGGSAKKSGSGLLGALGSILGK